MKKRLTVNVDADLIAAAKRHAREHGVSLSSLVEESLREMAAEDAPAAQGDEFAKAWAARWRAWFSGELPPPARSRDPRYRYLDEGMGQSYGVRWGDDDQPLEHVRPPGPDDRPRRRRRKSAPGRHEGERGDKQRAASAPPEKGEPEDTQMFADRWYGKFEPAERTGDPRYDYLAKKYGL